MNNTESSFHISIIDIAANPYFMALYETLDRILPLARWWLLDEKGKRMPFSSREKQPFCEEAAGEPSRQEQVREIYMAAIKENERRCVSGIEECCEGYLQGFALIRYRELLLGGIGICHVKKSDRLLLEHVVSIFSGYLTLLGSALEDHDDLELVHRLWTETISVINVDWLLKRLMNEMCSGFGLSRGLILLIDEDGEFYPAQARGYPESILKNRNVEVTRYDYVERLEHSSSNLCVLPEEDPLYQWLFNTLGECGEKILKESHCLAVPFLRKAYLIGMFLSFSDRVPLLSDTKQSLIGLLAIGGAAALDNALTLERMNQRRKALSTIHVVHRLISSNITMKELLSRIGQLTRQLLKAKKCSIMLCDEKKERVIPHVCLGLDKNEVGFHALTLGEGLPGWVAENYNPVVYHPSGGVPPPWKNVGETYPSESYLAVPLFDNDIEGVITVAGKKDDFTPGDREILLTFSEQAVLAIKNTRAHEGERSITINILKSIVNLIENHDPARPGITVKTCEWADRIGRIFHLNNFELQNLNYASLLHDSGMLRSFVGVNSFDERRLKDPILSSRFVESMGLSEEVRIIVYHVNESWNGRGYPDGLRGNRIPLGSRIIAVAHAYATLLSRRNDEPEEERRGKALRVIKRLQDRTYDSEVVKVLEQAILDPHPGE